SRGMKWIQRQTSQSMHDAALKDYLRESHRLVVLKLAKLVRGELGLR
ncbi:MmcQ/YjbR family DNA-binding protein, partial [Mesorhizobium sp. M8A.F.Ca.ET.213.01.1.1]